MSLLHDVAKKLRQNTHQVLDGIIYRWSPKAMTSETINDQELTPLFEAARWAPSSSNNQEWHFFYATRESDKFKDLYQLLDEGNKKWCNKAGALMILISKKKADYKNKPIRTHAFDTGAAWVQFAIEGIRRNLVVHAMGGFDLDRARSFLGLDEDHQVQCMIAVGKPSQDVKNEKIKLRKPIDQITTRL